eukprot:TRINITY_DN14715_c3_g1_i1.p1 TRINITY_DN14715_c3_g1~~TRINITY_DN14715_c3_g1_i1.p1  ORF type:complete len:440 (+),score=-20.08 TRINITY_DN14715_c3_g1_i1:22-1320(+)
MGYGLVDKGRVHGEQAAAVEPVSCPAWPGEENCFAATGQPSVESRGKGTGGGKGGALEDYLSHVLGAQDQKAPRVKLFDARGFASRKSHGDGSSHHSWKRGLSPLRLRFPGQSKQGSEKHAQQPQQPQQQQQPPSERATGHIHLFHGLLRKNSMGSKRAQPNQPQHHPQRSVTIPASLSGNSASEAAAAAAAAAMAKAGGGAGDVSGQHIPVPAVDKILQVPRSAASDHGNWRQANESLSCPQSPDETNAPQSFYGNAGPATPGRAAAAYAAGGAAATAAAASGAMPFASPPPPGKVEFANARGATPVATPGSAYARNAHAHAGAYVPSYGDDAQHGSRPASPGPWMHGGGMASPVAGGARGWKGGGGVGAEASKGVFANGWKRATSPWRGRLGGGGGGESVSSAMGRGFVAAAVPRWVTPPRRFWKGAADR